MADLTMRHIAERIVERLHDRRATKHLRMVTDWCIAAERHFDAGN